MPVVFAEVKAILDQAIVDWHKKTGRDPDLNQHDPNDLRFSWDTLEKLKGAFAFGLQLIQPEVIKQDPKRGSEANLVKVLRAGIPGKAPRMPKGGPFRTAGEIQLIEDWIDDGCL